MYRPSFCQTIKPTHAGVA